MGEEVTEDVWCRDCGSKMVEDNGSGHLCPLCDAHPASACGDVPCSGMASEGTRCALNRLRVGMDPEWVRVVAVEVKKHKHDTLSQDTGMSCVCGSTNWLNQSISDDGVILDPKWSSIDEHVAQQVLRAVVGAVT